MNYMGNKLLSQLKKGEGYEEQLSLYIVQMLHLEYEYSVVLTSLQYYTLGEVVSEALAHNNAEEIGLTKDFMELFAQLQTCIYNCFVADENNREALAGVTKKAAHIREEIMHKMQILTCYTDNLQLYEYVMNRLEAEVLDKITDVDVPALCEQIYQFIFNEKDAMVINNKLQMVTTQLPVRMTKQKFFDAVSQAFSRYQGFAKSNFDEFVERIRSTVLLDRPEGYETEYPELYAVIKKFAEMDYGKLSKEEFVNMQEELLNQASYIEQIVSNYLILADVVNSVYAAALAMPYANVVSDALSNGRDIIKLVFAALDLKDAEEKKKVLEQAQYWEKAIDKLVLLEGAQEQLMEELGAYEGMFYEVYESVRSMADADEGVCEKLKIIDDMQKLHSNSSFVSLDRDENEDVLAESDYIGEVSRKFEKDMTALLEGKPRMLKRAYMAAVIGQLPAMFSNVREIQEYIQYTLNHCGNDSELWAVDVLLADMMVEWSDGI